MVPGTRLPSSARNLPQPNESMPLLTESSSHYTLASNSFTTTLKADHSPPSLIISPFVEAMTNAVGRSPRQTRHLSFVAEFTNDVQHVSGQDNVVADALSRTPTIATVLSPEINYRQLAADQATSDEIHAYCTEITGLKLEDVPFQDFAVLCEISTGYIRPIIPREWRRCIFDTIHRLSHTGYRPTLRAISRWFVWHKMKTDVYNWCRTCHPYQSSKVQRHVLAPLQPRTLPG